MSTNFGKAVWFPLEIFIDGHKDGNASEQSPAGVVTRRHNEIKAERGFVERSRWRRTRSFTTAKLFGSLAAKPQSETTCLRVDGGLNSAPERQ